MTATEILNKAADHLKDRAATYDKPEGERSMAAAVRAFLAVTGDGLMNTPERGWLFMALLKAVRSQQGGFKADNYEDGAAYFALAGEAAAVDRAPLAELCTKLKACTTKDADRERFADLHDKQFSHNQQLTPDEHREYAGLMVKLGISRRPLTDHFISQGLVRPGWPYLPGATDALDAQVAAMGEREC